MVTITLIVTIWYVGLPLEFEFGVGGYGVIRVR